VLSQPEDACAERAERQEVRELGDGSNQDKSDEDIGDWLIRQRDSVPHLRDGHGPKRGIEGVSSPGA
jgi:hypothetical protein